MDQRLQRLHSEIMEAIRGMSPEDLARHPEGQWSAAQVLEHLYRTYTATAKGFARWLEAGHPQSPSPTMKQRMLTLITVGVGIMPGRRKAPPFALPKGMPVEEVLTDLEPKLAAMDEIVSQCEGRFGKRRKLLSHQILGPLTGEQWRKFHCAHGRHHIRQIERLRHALKSAS